MNKIIKNIMLLSFLSLGAFNFSTSPKNNVSGFEEIAEDLLANQSKLINLKAANNNSKDVQTSKMFIQNGVTSEGKKCLRFAVALKGNIDSLAFQRGHVEGKEDVDIKSVSAIYKAIEANGKVYYYSPSSNSDDGLTTDETYAGDYYWACYTIRYLSDDFNTSNIPMTLLINGEQTVTRKASLAESVYGTHTHNYANYLYNDTNHYKTCSLCGTIDETSYEAHSFELTPAFSKSYNVGDTFEKGDLSLSQTCICHKELKSVNFTYLKTPSTIAFGDRVIVKINGEVKKIVLPTNDRKNMSKSDTTIKYGGGNAGIVGKDTNFKFKEEYEIVDGKFKAIEPQGNYPYGNVFINIDMFVTNNPYMEFPIEIANDASVRLFLSTSNNYTKQDDVIGSYEQELKKTMDLVIDGETIDYNDITLKALPQSAIDELNKSSKDDLKSHIYFTFYEYELVTKKLSRGSHSIRLNFKNGYADTGAASIDTNQPCVGCINYLRYETLTEFGEVPGATSYIELEDNTMVDYGSGTKLDGSSVTPGSKLKITKTYNGTYKYGSTEYQSYEEAYEAAYNNNSTSPATKEMVPTARGKDFLASIDGTGASFTINLRDVYTSKKELYLCGASNFATEMNGWVPKKIDDMNLKDFMTVEVNGKQIELVDDLILPGIGDGSSENNLYWTNWTLLNLGVIELDTTLDVNTIKFTVSIDNALNEEGKYKYIHKQNMYAFGQYDYVMLKDAAD